MIVYDQSINCFNFYENDAWSGCVSPSAASNEVLASLSGTTTIADLNAILPALTGVAAWNERTYQAYIVANPGEFSSPATQAEVQTMIDAVNPADVTGPDGNTWFDRNLGAFQVATSGTDTAAYGNLYQWGRGTDGHEARNSSTTTTTSAGNAPGHGDFIIHSTDWRTTQNDDLWQGVNGTNNPCPTGYRLPTEAESTGLGITNSETAFSSSLKLPLTGFRRDTNATLYNVGTNGHFWSSTISGTSARAIRFYSGFVGMKTYTRSSGYPVRCLKD